MSVWLDIKFVKQISFKLERFKIKKDGSSFLAVCRCPICGDSKKNLSKTRGYFYDHDNSVFYKCWNCGVSMPVGVFIRQLDPSLYNVYRMENYRESSGNEPRPPKDEVVKDKIIEVEVKLKESSFFSGSVGVLSLDDDHPAKKYVLNRMLPDWAVRGIHYADKFYEWSSKNTDRFESLPKEKDHPRIIIPWYSVDKTIFAYQARALGNESPKYYTILLNEKYPKIYGMDRVDLNNAVYVVEGPIDSMFLPNAVAVGGANLTAFDHPNAVFIPDRDVRNFEVMKMVYKMISDGRKVCMLPPDLPGKDFNEMILNGIRQEDLIDIVNKSTFDGLEARLHFSRWSKVKL